MEMNRADDCLSIAAMEPTMKYDSNAMKLYMTQLSETCSFRGWRYGLIDDRY